MSLDQQLAELMRRSRDGDRHAYEAFLVEVMALVTISKEIVALRSALKLARRAWLFEGDPGAICPHGFAPEYEPRKRFLTREELCRLLASQTKDHAAQIAFMVATSAEGSSRAGELAVRPR